MFSDPETMDAQINNPGWGRGTGGVHPGVERRSAQRPELLVGEDAAVAGGQAAEFIGWGYTA